VRHRIPRTILSAAASLVLLWYAAGTGAQPILATGPDADVTEEDLHRVDPSIMEAAWVRPDLDLSRYSRILLVPTGVQLREVANRHYNVRTRGTVTEFPLDDGKKEWLRGVWRIPPDYSVGSGYSFIRDPWSVSVVLELRDGTTAELLARTIDRRNAEGLVDVGTVWVRTEDLVEVWAGVLFDRLQQLSDLGAPGHGTPTWAR
jgi:hypothetical protein